MADRSNSNLSRSPKPSPVITSDNICHIKCEAFSSRCGRKPRQSFEASSPVSADRRHRGPPQPLPARWSSIRQRRGVWRWPMRMKVHCSMVELCSFRCRCYVGYGGRRRMSETMTPTEATSCASLDHCSSDVGGSGITASPMRVPIWSNVYRFIGRRGYRSKPDGDGRGRAQAPYRE